MDVSKVDAKEMMNKLDELKAVTEKMRVEVDELKEDAKKTRNDVDELKKPVNIMICKNMTMNMNERIISYGSAIKDRISSIVTGVKKAFSDKWELIKSGVDLGDDRFGKYFTKEQVEEWAAEVKKIEISPQTRIRVMMGLLSLSYCLRRSKQPQTLPRTPLISNGSIVSRGDALGYSNGMFVSQRDFLPANDDEFTKFLKTLGYIYFGSYAVVGLYIVYDMWSDRRKDRTIKKPRRQAKKSRRQAAAAPPPPPPPSLL